MTVLRTRCLLVAAALALVGARRAEACGGLFCDRPPTPSPVDLPVAQTGENVLFVMDPAPGSNYHLEAHIQIQYTGPADKFSWVVPVDGEPTLDVGSNAVFSGLDTRTRPQILVTRKREGVCSDDPVQTPAGGFGGSSNSSASRDGGADGGVGVQVDFHGNVGPFDAVVVRADDAARLKSWLADNGYYLSDEAGQIIDTYVQEGKFFVALKLLSGRGVSEIQPIVLRFDGRSPCVPLRLTAIAALADLRVNLWVLSAHRVVPQNYYEMAINEAKLDWLGNGSNYQDLLKSAANEAGGNAFAVEYAGSTSVLANAIVPPGGNFNLNFATIFGDPQGTLMRAGIGPDPAALRIIERYRAMQPNLDFRAFENEIETQIIAPRLAAQKQFDTHATLTRLVTFISPEEMKVDPTFIENDTLPAVSNVRTADAFLQCGARNYSSCNAPMRVALPDGRSVFYKAPAAGWCGSATVPDDRGAVDRMPSLERAWQREATGEGAVRFDNRAAIADLLKKQEDDVMGACSCALGGRRAHVPWGWLLVAAAILAWRRGRR